MIDVMKSRWPGLILVVTMLGGMAVASEEPAQQLSSARTEIALFSQTTTNSQTSVPSAEKEPASSLDRRDRIFYPGDTERLKPLAQKLVLNVLLDQKEIFTSPFT
jgi:hypothetical protein